MIILIISLKCTYIPETLDHSATSPGTFSPTLRDILFSLSTKTCSFAFYVRAQEQDPKVHVFHISRDIFSFSTIELLILVNNP